MNTRVLVRGAADVLRRGEVVLTTLPGAIQDLSRAVRALGSYLEESAGPEPARLCALEAAHVATETLRERYDLRASVLTGQVRFMSVDLLRSTGTNQGKRPSPPWKKQHPGAPPPPEAYRRRIGATLLALESTLARHERVPILVGVHKCCL